MANNSEYKSKKGLFTATVYSQRLIGPRFYRLELEFTGHGAEAFAEAGAGQFAELDLCNAALPDSNAIPEDLMDTAGRGILLRRPFSFCDVTTRNGKTFVEILYRVAGPATLRMTTLTKGQLISVIGPLGNGFSVPENKKMALLVVGGMGAGPLIHLAKILTESRPDIDVVAFAGAKTAVELPFEKRLDKISQGIGFSLAEFGRFGIESMMATDDGSAGFEGFVTDCLTQWLDKKDGGNDSVIIYSCGPEVMLAKVAEIAEKRQIDCQVSMERLMACGMGLCQSCAVECRVGDSQETIYKMCCKDGPVFDSREVVFNL